MSYDRFPETKIIGYDHEVFNDEQAIYQELLKYKDLHIQELIMKYLD